MIPISILLYVPVAIAIGVALDWAFSIRLISWLDHSGYSEEDMIWWTYVLPRLKWIALASLLMLLGMYLDESHRAMAVIAGAAIFLISNVVQYFRIVRDARPKR